MAKRGKNNPMYGKPITEEHRENLSKAKSGENHPCSKLTENDVKLIKLIKRNANLTQLKIGNMFGITHQTVSDILRDKTWRNTDV